MPSTSIENETNILTAPQDLSTLFAPFFKQGGTPEDAVMNMAEVLKSAKQIVITGGSVATSTPLLTTSITYNGAGVTMHGFVHDFTVTAAADASSLFRWRLGGSDILTLTRYGDLQGLAFTTTLFGLRINNSGVLLANNAAIKWTIDGSAATNTYDCGLDKLAAGVVEVTDGSTGRGSLATKSVENGTFAIADAADYELNPRNGYYQTWTLTANRTPRGNNFLAGQEMILMVDDGTGPFGVTWTHASLNVVWIGGSPPTLPTSGYAIIKLFKVGSTVYGKHEGNA